MAGLKDEHRITSIRYLMFAYNFVFVLCACAIMAVGVWVVVDGSYFSNIVGNHIYAVSTYFMVISGALMLIVAFFGCCGSVTENKCMLWTFFIVQVIIFLILLIAAILAGVFRAQITGAIKDTMRDTLQNTYGVDFHHEYNRRVTNSWDKAQERLRCCGVESGNWYDYRESEWFKTYGAQDSGTEGNRQGDEDMKPYVPQSCCVKDRFWRYINLDVCQKWRLGPPGSPVDGGINRALYYTGCYEAGKEYIMKHSTILVIMGVLIVLFLIVGIIGSFILIRNLKKREQHEAAMRQTYDGQEMKGLQS